MDLDVKIGDLHRYDCKPKYFFFQTHATIQGFML